MQTGSVLSDPKRFKFTGEEHYLKTADEMRYLFRDYPEACDNTLWIAERADVTIEFGKVELPDFPLPEGFTTTDEYLAHLTWDGAASVGATRCRERSASGSSSSSTRSRRWGSRPYFLIVWDLIAYAKGRGSGSVPGRGSAAGCAVAYCLRITELDPIRYDLLFERFLNPSRVSMPDIDMDFDSRYRDEMIRYASEKYGRDHVAQIITFGTIKARNGVRDAARVLGMPYAVGDKIAKAMPPLVMGRDTPLKYCFERSDKYADGYKAASDLRAMYDSDPEVKKVVDVAKGLEGLKRSDGIHAAAVVITKEPLTDLPPRAAQAGERPEPRRRAGRHAVRNARGRGPRAAQDGLPRPAEPRRHHRRRRDDPRQRPPRLRHRHRAARRPEDTRAAPTGSGIGIFQMEGGPLRALMKSLRPTSFDDVSALIALYRPGPMAANMHNDYADRKNGRKPIAYDHPDLEEVLGDTYGLMIYQESMMRVAQRIAGYSLADADNLRKACLPAGSQMLTWDRGAVAIEHVMALPDRRVETIDETTGDTVFESVDDVWSVGVKPVAPSGDSVRLRDHRHRRASVPHAGRLARSSARSVSASASPSPRESSTARTPPHPRSAWSTRVAATGGVRSASPSARRRSRPPLLPRASHPTLVPRRPRERAICSGTPWWRSSRWAKPSASTSGWRIPSGRMPSSRTCSSTTAARRSAS